ncbi:MAG: methylmalonyl-CoA epimerase [Acidobacteria bacterium]|nr:methylmalonyl-CoA epimerase [Acidobacteriota bacterium]
MKIDHLGIAVESLETALKFYRDALGLAVCGEEVVEDQGVKVAMLPIGDSRVELLEATHDNSPIAKYIAKRGPGIHHICIRVDDVAATLAILKDQGYQLIDQHPRPGADGCLVAFVHPKSTHGVLLELSQKTEHQESE